MHSCVKAARGREYTVTARSRPHPRTLQSDSHSEDKDAGPERILRSARHNYDLFQSMNLGIYPLLYNFFGFILVSSMPTTRPKAKPPNTPVQVPRAPTDASLPGHSSGRASLKIGDTWCLMHTSATVLLTRPRCDEHISHTAAPLALSGPNPRPNLSHRLVLQSAPHLKNPISELRISELPRSKQIPPSFLAPSTSLHSRRSRHLHQSSPHPSQLG